MGQVQNQKWVLGEVIPADEYPQESEQWKSEWLCQSVAITEYQHCQCKEIPGQTAQRRICTEDQVQESGRTWQSADYKSGGERELNLSSRVEAWVEPWEDFKLSADLQSGGPVLELAECEV